MIKDALQEEGWPVLVLEGDCMDGRNEACGGMLTRMQAFLEILQERKGILAGKEAGVLRKGAGMVTDNDYSGDRCRLPVDGCGDDAEWRDAGLYHHQHRSQARPRQSGHFERP